MPAATPYYKEGNKGDEVGAHTLADCWRKGMPPAVYQERTSTADGARAGAQS